MSSFFHVHHPNPFRSSLLSVIFLTIYSHNTIFHLTKLLTHGRFLLFCFPVMFLHLTPFCVNFNGAVYILFLYNARHFIRSYDPQWYLHHTCPPKVPAVKFEFTVTVRLSVSGEKRFGVFWQYHDGPSSSWTATPSSYFLTSTSPFTAASGLQSVVKSQRTSFTQNSLTGVAWILLCRSENIGWLSTGLVNSFLTLARISHCF